MMNYDSFAPRNCEIRLMDVILFETRCFLEVVSEEYKGNGDSWLYSPENYCNMSP